MTAHEMVLLCSSLPDVRTCIPSCLVLRSATLSAFGKNRVPPTEGLVHAAACRSTANFFLGTVGACSQRTCE